MIRLAVFVPVAEELRQRIWRGSGIVGSPVERARRLRLDFEGDGERYPAFEDRVRRAAERHQWEGPSGKGYPTSAMAYVDPGAVAQVGWWNLDEEALDITKPDLLSAWLDEAP